MYKLYAGPLALLVFCFALSFSVFSQSAVSYRAGINFSQHPDKYLVAESANIELVLSNKTSSSLKIVPPSIGLNVWGKLVNTTTGNTTEFKDIISKNYSTLELRRNAFSDLNTYGVVMKPGENIPLWLDVNRLLGELNPDFEKYPSSFFSFYLKPGKYEFSVQFFYNSQKDIVNLNTFFEVIAPTNSNSEIYQQYVQTIIGTLALGNDIRFDKVVKFLDTYPQHPYADNVFTFMLDNMLFNDMPISHTKYVQYYLDRMNYPKDPALLNRMISFQIFFGANLVSRQIASFNANDFYQKILTILRSKYSQKVVNDFIQSGKEKQIDFFLTLK